jgi:uncharacterized membrane protein
MGSDPTTSVLTILGMALVTYMTRAGGLWLMGRVASTPRVEAWLKHIPGAVLVSLVAPTALTSGPAESISVLATGLVAIRTRNFLLAIACGLACVWVLRRLFSV